MLLVNPRSIKHRTLRIGNTKTVKVSIFQEEVFVYTAKEQTT